MIFCKITKKTVAVFLTHAQGFNGLNKILLTLKKKKIHLLEDVCESHGATFQNKKLGTFGASNFSFYYALAIYLLLRVEWYAQIILIFMKY